MSNYKIRVVESTGKAYNAEVEAASVLIDDLGDLVFRDSSKNFVAGFKSESWVYFKKVSEPL